MSEGWRVDRRRFLAAGAATALAGAAACGTGSSPPRAPGAPGEVTVNGVADAVGVDPDDVRFAWLVSDPRLGARQGGYRIVVDATDGRGSGRVWDSGPVASPRQAFVAYGGLPLGSAHRYEARVRTTDGSGRSGPWSDPVPFVTGLRPTDWRAQWLRPGGSTAGLERYSYVRTTVTLPEGRIRWAAAFVAAAHKYQLWVNGTKVDTGPSFCFPDEQYYQGAALTDVLVAGRRNAIGFLHHWYGPGRGRPASSPGLLAQIMVEFASGARVAAGTDGSWRQRPGEWLPAPQRNTDAGDFVEWIDARRAPAGWALADFDDTAWAPADVVGPVGTAPFTHLYAQRTRISERDVRPVSVRTMPSGAVVADFGAVYAARPTVAFRRGLAGRTVPMHVGYLLDDDGRVSTAHGTQGTDLSFSYVQRGGAERFDPYTYLGFRYLEVDGPGEVLIADQIAAASRHCAMPTESPTAFSSSNPTLDAVRSLCARSGLFCSQEQFIDTPTREKGQFLWDAANESETVMAAFGDQNLSWQALRDMARAQRRYWPDGATNEIYPNDDGPQDYPTFTARYPEWAWRYYLATGDLATVRSLAAPLARLASYLWSTVDPATGLVSGLPHPTNGDNQYGYDLSTYADTTLNVLAVNAWNRIGTMLALTGDVAGARREQGRARSVAAAVNRLTVTATGLYADGLARSGARSPHVSQLANAAALAYGVVPGPRVAGVAAFVASQDISVEPDHGLELLRALRLGGRSGDVVRILTDASFPGWARILADGGTFTWETWTPSDAYGDSMSHGWGSSALVAIEETVLGVTRLPQPAAGSGALLEVVTPSAGVARAEGAVWTVSGLAHLAWEDEGGRPRLALDVPPNATVRLHLPAATPATVTVGGSPADRLPAGVTVAGAAGGSVELVVGGGHYDIGIRRR